MKSKVLKIGCILATIVAVLPLHASDFIVDGIYYNILTETTVAVTNQPSGTDVGTSYSGNINIPEYVTYNGATFSVTEIGNSAFSGCKNLTSMTIPASVATINNGAFNGCWNLSALIFEDGSATLYMGCNSSSEIRGRGLFYDCHLEKVYLGRNMSYKDNSTNGYSPFYGVSTLREVEVGNKVIEIGHYEFKDCSGLISVIIPESVTSIGGAAFAGCSGLVNVTIPNSVTSIGDAAFDGCLSLKSVTIPNSVTSIGGSAFDGCLSLKSVTIPNSVTKIGYGVFNGCLKLNTLVFEDGDETLKFIPIYGWDIENIYFNGCPIEKLYVGRNLSYDTSMYTKYGPFYNCSTIKELTIGNYVVEISENEFMGCTGLTSVTIPNSVKSIGDSAFYRCLSLKSVTISNSVTEIGNGAFSGCLSLKSVTIPNSVTEIGNGAFKNCGLTSIIIPGSVVEIGGWAFDNCEKLTNVVFEDGEEPLEIGPDSWENTTDYLTFRHSPIEKLYLGRNISYRHYRAAVESPFYKSSTLRELIIGNNVTKIKNNEFEGCSLKEVVIPSSVTTIGKSAFADNQLTHLTIGCGIEMIDNKAFEGNNTLTTINMTAVVPPIADDVFTTKIAQLNVLMDSREAYENSRSFRNFNGNNLVPISAIKVLSEPILANAASHSDVTNVDTQIQLSATVEPSNASLKDYIYWKSSNPDVAKVDNKGVVTLTGANTGTAEITVSSLYADLTASITVTATGEVESGINDIIYDSMENGIRPNDIYNLQGICLKRSATQDDIDTLSPGIYIIAGKKVLIK